MKREKTSTIVILPYDDDDRPIWDDSKPIAIPCDQNIFEIMTTVEALIRSTNVVLGTSIYRRANLRSILDLSMDEVTYAIPVKKIPNPLRQDRLDVDENGNPKFHLIKGGKYHENAA